MLYTSLVESSFSYSSNLIAVFIARLYSLNRVTKSNLLLVELALAEQEEMNCLRTFPRVRKGLVGAGADIRCDQTVHCFSSDFGGCLPCTCNLRYLRIKNSLLVTVYFKRGQHIDLLDQKQGRILFP